MRLRGGAAIRWLRRRRDDRLVCALCREPARDASCVACPACGVVSHALCAQELTQGDCPTPGCGATWGPRLAEKPGTQAEGAPATWADVLLGVGVLTLLGGGALICLSVLVAGWQATQAGAASDGSLTVLQWGVGVACGGGLLASIGALGSSHSGHEA